MFFLLTPIIALFYCTVARKGDKLNTLKSLLAQSVSFSEEERGRLSVITISYLRRGLASKGFPVNSLKSIDSGMQEHMYVWDYKKEFYLKETQSEEKR